MFVTIKTKKTSKSIALDVSNNIVQTHYTTESGPKDKPVPKLTIFLRNGSTAEFGGAATIEGILSWLDENSVRIIGGGTVNE